MSGSFAERFPMLRHASVLRTLPDNHFEGLLGVMQLRRMPRGEVLFQEGYVGDSMAVIAAGSFRVKVKTPDGKETEVRTLVPGDVVGEMACVDPAPRSATVISDNDAQVFLLNRQMLLALKTRGPGVLRVLLRGIVDQVTERIRDTNKRLEEKLSMLEERTVELHHSGREPFPDAVGRLPTRFTGTPDVKGVAGLQEFTPAEEETLVQVSRHLTFPKGAVLCKEREKGDSCYVIVGGDVGVYRAVDGAQKLLATVRKCLLGQMALVSAEPRSATLRALTEVVALELSRDTLAQLLAENSPFAIRFLELLAVNGIRQLREATARLATESAAPAPVPADPTPVQQPYPRTVDQATAIPRFDTGRLSSRPNRGGTTTSTHTAMPRTGQRQPMDKVVKARETREKLAKIRPETQRDAAKHTIAYMQASLQEWGMSLDDLDNISVSRPDGMMSAAETKARTRNL